MASVRPSVTLTSLAKELGLSTCTVSKILNNSMDGVSYSPSTIQRVEALARKRNYRPNPHARSLRSKRSMMMALVMPGGAPYFYGLLAEKIEGCLRGEGFETLVAHSVGDTGAERKLVEAVVAKGVDGLLWVPFGKLLRPEQMRINPRFPLVLLDRPGCSDVFPTVATDNVGASRLLAAKLAKNPSCQPLMISTDSDDDSISERELGIQEVFGRGVERLACPDGIDAACAFLLASPVELRGRTLLGLNQNVALGALGALAKRKLRPGKAVGFASFDDLPGCEIWRPGLTRIIQDLDVIAQTAARLLIEKIRDPKARQPREIRIAARLIWGNSTP